MPSLTPTALVRWMTLGALFAVPFLALLVDRGFYFPYVAARGFSFRLLAEAGFVGWILLALSDRAYRPAPTPILLMFAAYVVWMGVADLVAINPGKALWGNLERMDGWVTQVHLLAFLVAAAGVLGAERLWRTWWFAFVGASGLVCGYGLLQMAHVARVSHDATRIDALFGNPEFLAGYLLFAIAATLWLALDDASRRPLRYGLMGLAALQSVVLFQSGTRGALIGMAVGAGVGFLTWVMTGGQRSRRIGWSALAGAAFAIPGLFWYRQAPVVATDPILSRLASIGPGDLNTRVSLWRMAWEGFLDRPLLGWGHEGFGYVFNRFYDPSLAGQEPWFDRAHDLYLDVLVTGGAPALILFLGIFLACAVALRRAPGPRTGRIVLLGGLVAYAVQGIVVFDNLLTYVPFVALLAMVSSDARPAAPAEGPRWRINGVAIPIAALGLAVVALTVNAPALRSSRDLIHAIAPVDGGPLRLGYLKRAVDDGGFGSLEISDKLIQAAILVAGSPDGPEAGRTQFIAYAIDQAQAKLALAPHEARLRLDLAKLYLIVGETDAARRQVVAAVRDAPRHPKVAQFRALVDARPAR